MISRFLIVSASAGALLAVTAGAGLADQYLGSYQARLSWKDHEASDGYTLDTAAQVVRQDRANVHKHWHTDEEDQDDNWFGTNAKRAKFEQMLNKSGAMSKSTRAKILNDEPLVEVDVYRNSVKVKIID